MIIVNDQIIFYPFINISHYKYKETKHSSRMWMIREYI